MKNQNHENCVRWCKLHLNSDKSAEWHGTKIKNVGKTLISLLHQLENTKSERVYKASFELIKKIKENIS